MGPHTFRHSFATHLVEDGYDIRTAQELLGLLVGRENGRRMQRSAVRSKAAAPEIVTTEEAMKSDVEAVAEDEAAYRSTTTTVMKIPVKLVPAVRALLAKRRVS